MPVERVGISCLGDVVAEAVRDEVTEPVAERDVLLLRGLVPPLARGLAGGVRGDGGHDPTPPAESGQCCFQWLLVWPPAWPHV